MVFFKHQLQVRQLVVGGVFVNVMHNLVSGQVPADMCLHDKAVRHDVSFSICKRMFWNEPSAIPTLSAVPDFPPRSRLRLGLDTAFNGAEFLRSPSGLRNINSASSTSINGGLSKPSLLFALHGADGLLSFRLAPVSWVEMATANFTGKRNVQIAHVDIIPHEERYCEIAAMRLSQDLLPFGDDE